MDGVLRGLRLSMLLFTEWPFISGELTPPTRVLVLIDARSITDPTRDVGRD
jgi:hypothetical protein